MPLLAISEGIIQITSFLSSPVVRMSVRPCMITY